MTNGETVEHGYTQYGVLGWTPELDECGTGGGINCQSNFIFPDEEDKVQGVFLKNLDFALNVAVSAKDPEEPRNSDSNPSTYRVKPTVDIDPTPLSVSYGAAQTIEAITKKSLGSVSSSRRRSPRPARQPHRHPYGHDPFEGGERLGDRPGTRSSASASTTPVDWSQHPTQSARFGPRGRHRVGDDPRGRPVAVLPVPRRGGAGHRRPRASSRRSACSSWRRRTTPASRPNRRPGYDVAPRYLQPHVDALTAAGYEVEVFNADAPPLNAAGSPSPKSPRVPRRPVALRRGPLLHG